MMGGSAGSFGGVPKVAVVMIPKEAMSKHEYINQWAARGTKQTGLDISGHAGRRVSTMMDYQIDHYTRRITSTVSYQTVANDQNANKDNGPGGADRDNGSGRASERGQGGDTQEGDA